LWAFYSSAGQNESDNILVRIAIAMRAHGRGGSLLVVPRNTKRWLDSIVHPVRYSVIPPFPDIRTFLDQREQGLEPLPITLQAAAEALAGLTAVDGATGLPSTPTLTALVSGYHIPGKSILSGVS
jgi:hypothetical protein